MAATAKNSTANVSVGKGAVGGYAFYAPYGTTLPTTNSEELDTAFRNIGYINEDGVTFTDESDSESIPDMNGDSIVTTAGAIEKTFTFFAAETKADTLKLQYGDANVTDATGTITVHDKGPNTGLYSVVFDFRLKDGRKERCIVPCSSVSELGDLVYNYQELVGREITMAASLDATLGDYYVRYIDSTETKAA